MRFQLDITITEEDYLALNTFHLFESSHGKKQILKGRIMFVSVMAILMVFVVAMLGWTTFSTAYVVVLGLFTGLYMLLYKKHLTRNVKKHMKRLKKIGKLPFSPVSKFEFYEDRFVETTENTRAEQSYSAIERICVVGDCFVFLYISSIGAHMLPIPQIVAQINKEEFLSFLSEKCNAVEYY